MIGSKTNYYTQEDFEKINSRILEFSTYISEILNTKNQKKLVKNDFKYYILKSDHSYLEYNPKIKKLSQYLQQKGEENMCEKNKLIIGFSYSCYDNADVVIRFCHKVHSKLLQAAENYQILNYKDRTSHFINDVIIFGLTNQNIMNKFFNYVNTIYMSYKNRNIEKIQETMINANFQSCLYVYSKMIVLMLFQTQDLNYINNSFKNKIFVFRTSNVFENNEFKNANKNEIINFTCNELTGVPSAYFIFDHLLYLINELLQKKLTNRYQIIIRIDFEQFIFKYVYETIVFLKYDLKNFEKSNNDFEDNIQSILAFEASNLFYEDFFENELAYALKNSDDTKFENMESLIIFDSSNDKIENFHDKFFENLEENEKFLIDDLKIKVCEISQCYKSYALNSFLKAIDKNDTFKKKFLGVFTSNKKEFEMESFDISKLKKIIFLDVIKSEILYLNELLKQINCLICRLSQPRIINILKSLEKEQKKRK
ncbi:hypothetical protein GVAV_002511 [Gurleya vavrai]